MELPFISIVMPLYNKEKEVHRAIHSVLTQTFQDFELIVVNDGSTDKGPEIVRSFEDPRIRIIVQLNQGVSAARNRGITEAKADLIAFLDADDEWKLDYLETILRLVNKFPEAAVFATGYMVKQSGVHERGAIVLGLPESFSEGILENYFIIAAHSEPPLWTSAVAVRKEALESVNDFPVGIYAGEDLLTWAHLAVRCKIAYSLFHKATFYAPDRMEDRPSRHPQMPDRVAESLLELFNDSALHPAAKKGLPEYIGLWHRMRAVIFIKLNNGAAARKEISSAIHYSGLTLRLSLLRILAFLPSGLMSYIFHELNKFRSVLSKGKT